MSHLRKARSASVAAAFTLSLIFLLFQNFSEINIKAKEYKYQLVELKHLSPRMAHSLAYGITSQGEAIGQSRGDDGRWHTVRWDRDGNVTDLGVRVDYKESGKIVYFRQPFSPKGVSIGPTPREFGKRSSHCNGECRLLGELADEVQLGYFDKKPKEGFVKMRGRGTLTIEAIPQATSIFPSSVNLNKEVVGTSSTAEGSRAFYWSVGKTIDLGAARGGFSSASDINDLGQIVGEILDENNIMRPVLWSIVDQKVSALDLTRTMGRIGESYQGRANAINNEGQVVGFLNADQNHQPFIWTAVEGVKDLNTLAKESDPLNEDRQWILEDSRGINNCGQIVSWGKKVSGGGGYSVLMRPLVPKPGCS